MDITRLPVEGKDPRSRSVIRAAASDKPRVRRTRRMRLVAAPTADIVGWIGILGNGLCKSETNIALQKQLVTECGGGWRGGWRSD